MPYPKWLYSADKEPALVKDEAAHEALGQGWVESPALCVKAEESHAEQVTAKPATHKKMKSAGSRA